MITPSRLRRFVLAASVAALLAPLPAKGLTLSWDGGSADLGASDPLGPGGTGTWNTTTLNWYNGTLNPPHTAWQNANFDVASFGGTGGTVSLGAPIVAGGLIFDVNGYTLDNGGTATNTLTLSGAAPTITVTNALDSATISAIMAGSANWSKAGPGTLVLSGANTFTGTTTVSGGTLSIGSDGNLGTAPGNATPGSLTLGGGTLATTASFTLSANRGLALATGGGTINTATGTTLTYGGAIAGSALTKEGAGTLSLSGTNTFNGGLNLNAGILAATALANLGAGPISLNGGTLQTTPTAQITFAAANTIAVGSNGGTIDNKAAFKLLISTAGGLTGSGTLTRAASAANTIAGANTNVLQISVANVGFTGAVVLNGGQNEISPNGFGNGLTTGNTITINSGAELTANNGTIANPLIINTGGNISGDQGTSTFSGPVTVNGNFNVRLGDFFQATNRNLIVSGNITSATAGAGVFTLLNSNTNTVAAGLGQTLLLNGDNSNYSANIAVPAGYTVSFGSTNSRGTGNLTVTSTSTALGGIGVGYVPATQGDLPALTTNSTVANGGIFQINTTGFSTPLDLSTLYGSTTSPTGGTNSAWFLGSGAGGSYTATSLGASNGVYRLGGGFGALTIANGVLTGAANVLIGSTAAGTNGTGSVILAGANDYTGTTTIAAGSLLTISNASALGASTAGTTVNQGGSLALTGGITINEPLTVTGASSTASVTNYANGLVNTSGTNTLGGSITANTNSNNFRINTAGGTLNLTGPITLSGGGTSTGLVFAGTSTVNQSGTISGGGSVIGTSTGTTTLSASNTFTGKVQIQQGTFKVSSINSVASPAASSSLGVPASTASIIELGNSTTTGTLSYTGTGETTDRVVNLLGTTGGGILDQSGSGLLKFTSNFTATGAGIKTLTLQGAGTGEISGVIPNNSATNLTSIAKASAGTWTLSGLNTYAGVTNINQGTLVINTLNNVGGGASSLGNPTTVANGTIGLGSGTTTALSGTLQYIGTGSTSDRVINLASTTGNGTLDQSGTGTFQVGAVTSTGAGAKTLTLTGSTSGVGVVNGAIGQNSSTNTTAVTKTGLGAWTLAGTNTYTGATTVSAGLLRINGNNSAATGAVAVNAGGSLGGTGTVGGAVTVATNGNLDLRDGAVGTLTLASTLTLSGTAALPNNLVFDLGSSTVDKIAATGAVTASTASGALITFNQLAGTPLANGTYPLITSAATSVPTGFALATTQSGGHTYALTTGTTGNIVQVTVGTAATGPASAVWGGTSSAVWGNAGNWYSDITATTSAGGVPGVGTNVSFYIDSPFVFPSNLNHTLGADYEINSLTFLGNATAAVTIGGATNALTIDATTANGNTAGNGISQLAAATHTISSRLGLGGAQTWTVAGGGGLTVSGLVFDVGSGFTLTKAGAGTLTLSGTGNTFTGDINVTGGVLAFAGNGGTNGDPLSLGEGNKAITITNNAIIRPTTNSNPTNTNTKRFIVGTGGATFDVANGIIFTLDDAGQFSGTGDLTVTGAGTGVVILTQPNNFSGNVTINGGALRVGSNTVLGTSTGRTISVNSGGALDASANVTTTSLPLSITLNGGTVSATSANGSFAHNLPLSAASTVSAGAGFTETLSGNITGGFGLTKTGAGTTVLSGTNTYAAASGASTIISAGTLQAAKTASLPNYSTAGQVTLASGAALSLNVGGTGEFTAADVTNLLSNGTFVTGSGIGFDTTNAGGSFTAPALTPTPTATLASLQKLGAGTLVLPSATNFSAGATTTIFNGTLSVATGVDNTLGTGAMILGTSAGVPANLDLGTTNQTVSTLTVPTNSATANTITVGDNTTFKATGAVTIGVNTGGTVTTKLNVTGPNGTFSIGAAGAPTNAAVQIGASISDGFANPATVDLSGVGTFFANLGTGTFRLGDVTNSGGNAAGGSTLTLAPTSTIIATTITSDSPDNTVTQTIKLGSGTNTLQANTITIGAAGNRSSGNLSFNTGTGTLTVRGLAGGTSRAAMNVAYGSSTSAATPTSTVVLTGHTVDLMLSSLNIAGRTGTNGGAMTGTFSFDAGTLDVTSIIVGNRQNTGTTAAGASNGTLNLGGGTVTVGATGISIAQNTSTQTGNPVTGAVNISGGAVTVGATAGKSITLGSSSNTLGPSTATLNITGGSLTLAGNIVKGTTTGSVTSTLTLNGAGALLDLGGKNIGATGAGAIDTLNFQAGTLKNVGEINGGGDLNKTTSGTLTLDGTNNYTGGTNVNDGTVIVRGTISGSLSVHIENNASLVLAGSGGNRIADAAALRSTGGFLAFDSTGGSGMSETIGALTLTSAATSVINFGTQDSNQLTLTGLLDLGTSNLSIYNWTGTPYDINTETTDRSADNTQDRLLFSNPAGTGVTPGQLTQISFYSDAGGTLLGTGYVVDYGIPGVVEIVPVPEPSTTVILLGASALLGLRRFRRRATGR